MALYTLKVSDLNKDEIKSVPLMRVLQSNPGVPLKAGAVVNLPPIDPLINPFGSPQPRQTIDQTPRVHGQNIRDSRGTTQTSSGSAANIPGFPSGIQGSSGVSNSGQGIPNTPNALPFDPFINPFARPATQVNFALNAPFVDPFGFRVGTAPRVNLSLNAPYVDPFRTGTPSQPTFTHQSQLTMDQMPRLPNAQLTVDQMPRVSGQDIRDPRITPQGYTGSGNAGGALNAPVMRNTYPQDPRAANQGYPMPPIGNTVLKNPTLANLWRTSVDSGFAKTAWDKWNRMKQQIYNPGELMEFFTPQELRWFMQFADPQAKNYYLAYIHLKEKIRNQNAAGTGEGGVGAEEETGGGGYSRRTSSSANSFYGLVNWRI